MHSNQRVHAAAESRGRPAYFAAQRISIENALRNSSAAQAAAVPPLRLPIYAGHYYAPVAFGSARQAPFMIDTGASRTTMSRATLEASKANYRVIEPSGQMTTADGRKVPAQVVVMLESLRLALQIGNPRRHVLVLSRSNAASSSACWQGRGGSHTSGTSSKRTPHMADKASMTSS